MEGTYNDELKIYRGNDYYIKEGIVLHQPTLGEICDFGEKDYFGMVHKFVAVPNDMKWQLDDIGIDYTTISEWKLFYSILCRDFTQEQTALLFGDLDFQRFELCHKKQDDSIVLWNPKEDIIIDEYTYLMIADILRKMHKIKKDTKMPGNETTKRFLIEDAREESQLLANQEWKSSLLNLISAMINSPGFKYNHKDVWDMKINAFMDSVSRISKIKNADLLLQSGYSGFGVDIKKIDNNQLDWLGEL